MSAAAIAPGEIVLEHASRAFSVRADQGRTLKGLLIGRRAGGPAPVQALRDVSLHVRPGETVGMIGRNGAGKTSTLRVLAGIIPLDSGTVRCGGRVVSLLELGAGFGRDFSGRENVYLSGAIYGFTKAQIEERLERIIAFSELGDFIDVPVRAYSAGMFVRLGFAIASHLDADTLLIDEVLAVGDEGFQRKCLRRISEQIAAGRTLVLVSHDAGAIERVCERVVVLDSGGVVFDGPTAEGLRHYHGLTGVEQAAESLRPRAAGAGVAIAEVELQDGAGRAAQVFQSGAAMRVVAQLSGPGELLQSPLRVVLEVSDERGAQVFRTTAELELAGGARSVAFEVPRLALLGGDYDLGIAAAPAGEAPAGGDRLVRFAVAREPDAEGVADLRGSWRVGAPAEIAS